MVGEDRATAFLHICFKENRKQQQNEKALLIIYMEVYRQPDGMWCSHNIQFSLLLFFTIVIITSR